MKIFHDKKTINLAFRFVIMVVAINFMSGAVAIGLAALLLRMGWVSFDHANPMIVQPLFFLSSLIVGTIIAVIMSKKTLTKMNNLLRAVEQIGKGNFDVALDEKCGPKNKIEISKNINKMARDLKGLEILRNDFISNFSHEFKTPIVSIQGFAKRLLTKQLSEEKKQEYLNIILEESTRLVELSSNTLYMSKLDSMDRLNDRKEFQLAEQIRQCVVLLEKQITKKNIGITVDVPEITYHGNEETLKQVWLNLLSNAIKFTDDGGKILISASQLESGVVLSISDNGIGMSEETVSRIFDKFYQGDTSHATQGNGLGLAIVKRIISFCGGAISVKSSLGEGSTFTVTLPT